MDQYRSALELASAIRVREVSPTEVMDETLRRIDERNGALNAVIWIDADDARARARAAEDAVTSAPVEELPPFHGVPIPIKDLYDVEGWPNTYGSAGASDDPRDETALPVQRLVDAGFLLCGRTNSPEFGTVTATENERYGITRNPWDLDRTSGGSSGGASAAVAGGMFTIAHASDGGGSIRIPATCTGLVGLKPSRGRITDRVLSWEGASTQGVVCHTVADTAAALDAMSAVDPQAWWAAPPNDQPFLQEVGSDPGRLRVAIHTEAAAGVDVDPECRRAVECAVAALTDLGHDVVEVRFDPHIEIFVEHFIEVVDAGLADYDVDWDRVHPYNQVGRRRAAAVDSLGYGSAIHSLQRWTREVAGQWGRDFDLLVSPTMAIQPPRAGVVLDEITSAPEQTSMTVLASVLFTSIFNMSGLPAISLPLHTAADTGLPIGVQLVAGAWQEGRLLRVASQLERAVPWSDRRPTPFW